MPDEAPAPLALHDVRPESAELLRLLREIVGKVDRLSEGVAEIRATLAARPQLSAADRAVLERVLPALEPLVGADWFTTSDVFVLLAEAPARELRAALEGVERMALGKLLAKAAQARDVDRWRVARAPKRDAGRVLWKVVAKGSQLPALVASACAPLAV